MKAQLRAVKNAETLESFSKALPRRKCLFLEPLQLSTELFDHHRLDYRQAHIGIYGAENGHLLFSAPKVFELTSEILIGKLSRFTRVVILYFIYSSRLRRKKQTPKL